MDDRKSSAVCLITPKKSQIKSSVYLWKSAQESKSSLEDDAQGSVEQMTPSSDRTIYSGVEREGPVGPGCSR